MSVFQNYPFNNTADYTKVNTEVSGGAARLALIPNPGQIFAQNFNADTGFTYDNTKAEFVGGLLRQKDQRLADAVFAANFNLGFASNWGATPIAVAPTQVGTPTIVGGKLDCLGSEANTGVYYDHADIGSMQSQGTIRFKFTPHYSGTPAANEGMIAIVDPVTPVSANRILILHTASGGTIRMDVRDGSNNLILNLSGASGTFAAWNPTAGQEYVFDLDIDGAAGEVRIYIDGVLFGTKSPGVFSRGSTATRLRVGSNTTYGPCDSKFDSVVLFNAVQGTHPASYNLPDYAYSGSKVDGPNFTYTGVGTVLSVDDASIIEVGAPRYIVGLQYWNGSAWVVSNGTYAQANDFATLLANIMSFDTGGGGVLPWSVVFTDTNTLSSVDDFSVEVTGEKYSPTGYLEPVVPLQVSSLVTYSQEDIIPAGNEIGIILKIDGILKYHDGAAWTTSDGSLGQSNSEAELAAALGELSLGANSEVFVRWVLGTDSNVETPEITDATIEYIFGALEINPATCLVYGYYKDIANNPIQGAKVRLALNKKAGIYQEANHNIIEDAVELTTDENGYFQTELVRTSEFDEGAGEYVLTITKGSTVVKKSGTGKLLFTVPDSETKDITDLLP